MPVIPAINKGACVGVLYKNKNGQLRVHNGKLAQKEASTSAQVVIRHVGNAVTMKTENLTLSRANVLAILKTPNFTPPCSPKKGFIEAGACIAVQFKVGTKTDVKNGKLLYGINKNGTVTCRINPNNPPPTIVYAHYNLVSQGNGHQEFVAQIVTRKNVTKVKRVTLE
ncbi:hypothetical protein EDM59_10680 [Brevibacillus nitrificans]|uniref:Uncharacterized protein n=1 Tax=Brevibacillus nitrificans TaxID=651560 RepID=A0A3M8DHJ8_9BACL|nr:hypothetical protein [Brevibacillus nitrificans]RNB86627.1 hypothetical protein EDM59_10680 [Brevibacillus nitrificans]